MIPSHTARSRSARSTPLSFHPAIAVLVALLGAAQSGAEPLPAPGEPPASAVIADLPFLDVPFSPRIHLDLARPGDPPLPVILDTGIRYSVGSPSAMKRLRAEPKAGAPGTRVRPTSLGIDLEISTFERIQREHATEKWVRFGGFPLRAFVLELDFVERRVRFIDAALYSVPEKATVDGDLVIPIHLLAGRPFLEITLNEKPVRVALDTTVTAPLWIGLRNLKLASIHPKTLPVLRARQHAKDSTLRLYETDSVRIGGLTMSRTPVLVANGGEPDEYGSSGAALGLGLLSQFKVRIDLQNGRLWLRRTRVGTPEFLGADYGFTRSSGAFLVALGNRWLVVGVLPESPAARAGLEPGDLLDPEILGRERPEQVLEAIRAGEPLLVRRHDELGARDVLIPVVAEAQASVADEGDEGAPVAEGNATAVR
jgi:hypothetical protein